MRRLNPLLLTATLLAACMPETTEPVADPAQAGWHGASGTGPRPGSTRTDTILPPADCPAPLSDAILVDASHDGGVWWFPQVEPFDPSAHHQGRYLAEHLRGRGYTVVEMGRGAPIRADSLLRYGVVIRAGQYGGYGAADLAAYQAFVACPRTLLLIGEFLRPGQRDALADALGVPFTGWFNGAISSFAPHPITAGVGPLGYVAGSVLDAGADPSVTVLGRLDSGQVAMGLLPKPSGARIFFLGDLNLLEQVPQPLVSNLVAWIRAI